ncbi:MAG: metallophosphoesterase [Enhydrobacter sp.]|nr:metallophosphoesterase [Enhydrobacter sp.]
MSVPVEISAWKAAPFDLEGETVFAIGDVHGCADELASLLDVVRELACQSDRPRRLVYLGDMVDRGPDSLGVLRLWAEGAAACGVDRVDRIIGNHEILMLLAMSGGRRGAKAASMWLAERTGGSKALEEMRAAVRDPLAPPSYELAIAALGRQVLDRLLTQRSHLRLGNVVFVHGGLDGRTPQATFLAPPWTAGTAARWACITTGFLDWEGGFGGTLVVHGHTPPHKHRPLTQMEDPHLFLHDRLGLDGGSAITGIVTGAEIRDGRYRILKAGTPK